MDFLTKLNLKTSSVLKIAGLALLAIIVVVVAIRLVGSSFNLVSERQGIGGASSQSMPSYDYSSASGYGAKNEEYSPTSLSIRNIPTAPSPAPIYRNNGTTGDNAEEFEVTEYNATIETSQIDKTCAIIADFKVQKYVIFENSSEYDAGCNYTFKVKKDNVNEILAAIKEIGPKELSENTYTIKQLVDDFTSETQVLEKKLASIDETLRKAVSAYDDITSLATRVQDVESLAKIIDSKISIIERLTQERININSQLDRIELSKAEQLDRLEYTYFHVNIYENKFVDGENLKDSWRAAIKEFVRDINQAVQDVTINLVAFLFIALQYVIYFLILLIVAKYGWQLVKFIWKK